MIRQSSEAWNCPSCTYQNQSFSTSCEVCSQANPTAPIKKMPKPKQSESEPGIICLKCTFTNPITKTKCDMCGAALVEDQEQIESQSGIHQKSESLISCKNCGFTNDVSNFSCVSCDTNLNDLHDDLEEEYYDDQEVEMRVCKICKCQVAHIVFKRHEAQCQQSQRIIQEMREEFPQQHETVQCLYCYQKCQIQLKDHYTICKAKIEFFNDQKSFDRLSPVQLTAIKFMYQNSQKQHYAARPRIARRARQLGFKITDVQALHHYIQNYAPIIVHIHVSRYMQLFVKDSHYRNQFETNTSSGSLSNSSRTNWENRMFNHKYAKASGFQRVKYGTVNLTNDPTGVQCCLGYGNSYFLLKEHVRKRCTFTDMDSSSASSKIGVFKFGFHVLELLSDQEFKAIIQGAKAMEVSSRVVSAYKEIQIHGPLDFSKDVERVYVNEVELTNPDMLKHVKAFSEKFKVDYEIFKPKAPEGFAGPFTFTGVMSGRGRGRALPAPKKPRKPRKI